MLDSKPAVPMTSQLKVSPRACTVCLGLLTTFASPAPPLTAAAMAVSDAFVAAQSGGVAAADRMQHKLEAIVKFGAIPRLETQSTVIEEGEVNAYLALRQVSHVAHGSLDHIVIAEEPADCARLGW